MTAIDYDLLHVMQTLGRNLRDAGALCAAYNRGGVSNAERSLWSGPQWEPGCGRALR